MNLKEQLENIPKLINKETLRVNGNIFRKDAYQELKKEIENKFSQYENIKMNEMLYLILHDLEERPRCKCERHGELTFTNYATGYYTFCGKPNKCKLNAETQAKKMSDRKLSMTIEEKEDMYEKIKSTNLERYGVDNYFKHPEFIKNNYDKDLVALRDKNRKESVMKKYGVDNVSKLETVKNKIIESNIEKYGVPNYMQTFLSEETLELLNDKEWLESKLEKYSITYVARLLNCYPCTVTTSMKKFEIEYKYKNITCEESIIKSFFEDNNFKYEMNNRSVLNNKHELDFYIKDKNFAVEVNGLYWHSEIHRPDRNYHHNKYKLCKEKNIFLFQFWDYEINDKYFIVESMIKNKLKLTENKYYARKCEIKVISNYDASIFIQNNHLQDIKDNQISTSIGLFYKDELISVISFKKNKDEYILNRYCNLINTNVVGGFSKMIKYFVTNFSDKITTYSDNRYSQGDLYKNNGFELVRTNDVSYHYTKDFKMLYHRTNFTMEKMKNEKDFIYDQNITDQENMLNNKYYRVYGCKIDTWKYTK